MSSLISILADDKKLITYRPRLNKITGSVNATILFQQMIFRWESEKRRAFYKFAAPAPNNRQYKEGDSWQEELGFTRSEFENARHKIAVAIKPTDRTAMLDEHAIIYWRDQQNLTWYDMNAQRIEDLIARAYSDAGNLQSEIPNAGNPQPRMQETRNLGNAGNPQSRECNIPATPLSESEIKELKATEIDSHTEEQKRAHAVWESAYGQLALQLPKEAFDTWLRPATLASWDGGVFTLQVQNLYAQGWLEGRMKKPIERTLSQIAGYAARVEFAVKD